MDRWVSCTSKIRWTCSQRPRRSEGHNTETVWSFFDANNRIVHWSQSVPEFSASQCHQYTVKDDSDSLRMIALPFRCTLIIDSLRHFLRYCSGKCRCVSNGSETGNTVQGYIINEILWNVEYIITKKCIL